MFLEDGAFRTILPLNVQDEWGQPVAQDQVEAALRVIVCDFGEPLDFLLSRAEPHVQLQLVAVLVLVHVAGTGEDRPLINEFSLPCPDALPSEHAA